METVALTL